MKVDSYALSDRGLTRPNNEDAILERPDLRLWAVADGMGGHAAGEIASGLAIETLDRSAEDMPSASAEIPAWLRRSFAAANDAIRAYADAVAETRGMGTTLTALAVTDHAAVIAHVGDSRAYRLRNGDFLQVTGDHTWVRERVDAGLLTPERARDHPYSSVLTRVLGMDASVPPDVVDVDLDRGDVLLLCSDGLTGMVNDVELRSILDRNASLDVIAQELVATAKSRGGLDNISLVVLRVPAPPP
ncbi:MAG: Stp1/IreP family PP2C-type Ser/Thr phosphatase [Gemmatimonadetes bacterium]|nr:Stp1/IreP family PP2C-type Ser/Thr phosphatase [Gemmatimonadota bacterium]